ncbi:MAG: 16S rRNA (cytosine(967)-C(5))-methyltransferase RsmB [Methylococcaceae bacterium]|nr:16S rRNA (cytosine(967)-C(5))-methyltransferase RsmB [Methylococcaceae bacterium]
MNIRTVAASVLQRVLKDRQSLTVALDAALPAVAAVQDRAFIQALCYGVVRHYFELDALLSALLDKPLKAKDTEVKALALMGLYQLKYMRVKEHAAVSETVAAAKRQPWAKALLNAVFRRYAREQETLEALLSKDWQTRHNHPDWLITRFKQDWPKQAEALLVANNQPPPLALRVNLARCSREDYLALLAAAGITAISGSFSSAAVIVEHPLPVNELPQFVEGWVSVQDTAAQLTAQLLDVQPGQRVLDLCAAPGGKTCAILEMQPALKAMWAVDVDANRLQRVQANLERLGLQAELRTGDALAVASWWDGQLFERILVDAPCSALGVIRRHPDIKLLRLSSDIEPLVELQRRILQQAWQFLAPGGVLVYATCSVLKQENEQQMQRFLSQQPDATEWIIEAAWGLPASVGRQILTGMQAMDGFYYARLFKL